MKKFLCVSLSFIFFVTFIILIPVHVYHLNYSSVFSHNDDDNSPVIIVDAGHGGEDGGAVATDNTLEKDLNLDIALKLQEILILYGFNVIMTRSEDIMTCDDNLSTQRAKKISDIRNRFKIIDKNPGAVFVSIHQNNFYDKSQKGVQVFYSPNNADSKTLADCIQKSFVSTIQPDNKRLTKKSGTSIFLLYHSKIPSVLVECGFLSNNTDLSNLKNEEYRTKTALIIADGIINYYKR